MRTIINTSGKPVTEITKSDRKCLAKAIQMLDHLSVNVPAMKEIAYSSAKGVQSCLNYFSEPSKT